MASKLSVGAPVAGFLAVIALVCGTTAALGQNDLSTEVKESVELRVGEAAPAIEPLKLTSSTLFVVSAGENEIVLRVTPDGFMQFVETGTRVAVTVRGARKNTVSFELQKGELASVWPVVVIRLSLSGADKVVLGASSPDWAFVVRAEEVRKGGLPAVADGTKVTLVKNERLDAAIDEKTNLDVEIAIFSLVDDQSLAGDGVLNGGVLGGAAGAAVDENIGTEIDVKLSHQFTDDLAVGVGMGYLATGDTIDDNGGGNADDPIIAMYLSASLSF